MQLRHDLGELDQKGDEDVRNQAPDAEQGENVPEAARVPRGGLHSGGPPNICPKIPTGRARVGAAFSLG
jgi:hypothetical protein